MPTQYHIVPIQDTRQHELSIACWCQPYERNGCWQHKAQSGLEEPIMAGGLLDGRLWRAWQTDGGPTTFYTAYGNAQSSRIEGRDGKDP